MLLAHFLHPTLVRFSLKETLWENSTTFFVHFQPEVHRRAPHLRAFFAVCVCMLSTCEIVLRLSPPRSSMKICGLNCSLALGARVCVFVRACALHHLPRGVVHCTMRPTAASDWSVAIRPGQNTPKRQETNPWREGGGVFCFCFSLLKRKAPVESKKEWV